MLKIWGRVNSVNVKKVLWCVGELGLRHAPRDPGGLDPFAYSVVHSGPFQVVSSDSVTRGRRAGAGGPHKKGGNPQPGTLCHFFPACCQRDSAIRGGSPNCHEGDTFDNPTRS